jgi:DivIVA domain-containing protein
MVDQARGVTFPPALRGYERAAVDRYVQQVNRLIAELEVSSSPEAAVRHALAEVSEETRQILQHAHETADEVVLRSRAKADETVREAEREAQEVVNTAQREAIDALEAARQEAQALLESARSEAAELHAAATREASELRKTAGREAEQVRTSADAEAETLLRTAREKSDELLKAAEVRARELADNADSIWRMRRRLIEDVRVVGEQLVALAEGESNRFASPTAKAEVAEEGSSRRTQVDHDLTGALQEAIDSTVAAGEAP